MSEAEVKQAIATFTYKMDENNDKVISVEVQEVIEDDKAKVCISNIDNKIPVREETVGEDILKIFKDDEVVQEGNIVPTIVDPIDEMDNNTKEAKLEEFKNFIETCIDNIYKNDTSLQNKEKLKQVMIYYISTFKKDINQDNIEYNVYKSEDNKTKLEENIKTIAVLVSGDKDNNYYKNGAPQSDFLNTNKATEVDNIKKILLGENEIQGGSRRKRSTKKYRSNRRKKSRRMRK